MLQAWSVTPSAVDAIDDLDTISDHVQESSLVWVDALDPTSAELDLLAEEFVLHPLWMEDARAPVQRPKLEVADTHALLIGYAHDEDPTDLPEVIVFFSAHWLISIRRRNTAGRAFEIDDVRAYYERLRDDDTDVGLLLYAILDDMVDGYFDTVDAAEERIATIEEKLFDEKPDSDRAIQRSMLKVRRALIQLRRRVEPMRDVVLELLHREIPWIPDDRLVYFQDVLDRLLRIVDGVDVQRELLGNVVDAQLGLQANRMNKVMKKMTSWGAILIAATLISGIYGMNFKHMPELDWGFGYPAALASMLVVTGGLYLWFRHRDWL